MGRDGRGLRREERFRGVRPDLAGEQQQRKNGQGGEDDEVPWAGVRRGPGYGYGAGSDGAAGHCVVPP